MPFINDSRCGVWKIELNVSIILAELEIMLEKEYSEDITEGSKFWFYVIQIENTFPSHTIMPDFWDWFRDNYDNVETWNEIQDLFVNVEEEEEEEEDTDSEEKNTCYKCDVEVTQDNFYRDEFNNKNYNCCDDCGEEEDSDTDSEDKRDGDYYIVRHEECVYDKDGEVSEMDIIYEEEFDHLRDAREMYNEIKKKYDDQTSPYYAASRLWIDAIIDPLDTRKALSMGIEAANHAPIQKQFNLGLIQT